MRKCILILLMSLQLCFGQNKNIVSINDFYKNLIVTQMVHDFDKWVPLFVITPGFFLQTYIHVYDNEIFFKRNFFNDEEFVNDNDFVVSEMFRALNCKFIPYLPTDSNMMINAISGNKLMYTCLLKKSNNQNTISLSLPNQRMEKTMSFETGDFVSSLFKDDLVNNLTSNEKLNDSVVLSTKFNSGSLKYQVEKSSYSLGRLVKIEKYAPNKNRLKNKLRETVSFIYNNDGDVFCIKTNDKDGKVRDSIIYFYSGRKLTSVSQIKGLQQNSITYKYKDDNLLFKYVRSNSKEYEVNYRYMPSGQVSNMSINEYSDNYKHNYDFEYNVDGNLIKVMHEKIDKITNAVELDYQFLLGYLSDGNLSSIKMLNGDGQIIKNINYEIEYLKN
jgi:hypothetical protein